MMDPLIKPHPPLSHTMASDRDTANLPLPPSQTSSPSCTSPSTLRTSLKHLEPHSLHLLIDHLSNAAGAAATTSEEAEKNGRIPQRFPISLYSDLAKLHRKAIVPFIPRIMASIIRSFSPNYNQLPTSSSFPSSSSPHHHHQQQPFLLYEASAKVVSSIARYTIDPTSSASNNKEILNSLCAPLLSSLVNSSEEREGVALCLQSIVESEKWKYSDVALHRLLCDCINSALLNVYGNASDLNGSESNGLRECSGVNSPQTDVLCSIPGANEPKTIAVSPSPCVDGPQYMLSSSTPHSVLALDVNGSKSVSKAQLNSNYMASTSDENETQSAPTFDSVNGTELVIGVSVKDTQIASDLGVNHTQVDSSVLGIGMNEIPLVSPLGVNRTPLVLPLRVNDTLAASYLAENVPEPAAILHLMKSVTKFCTEAAQPHALEWFKLALNHLKRKGKRSSWQHRVASAHLISTILKTCNLLIVDLDLLKVKEILLSCQVHDALPVVRAAVAETLEALVGYGQNPCQVTLADASSPLKGFALHFSSPTSITSSSLQNTIDPFPSPSSSSSSSSSSRMKYYTTEVKGLPLHNWSASPSFCTVKPNSSPEWVSQQDVNSQIPVDMLRNPFRPGSLGSDKDFTNLSFSEVKETGNSYRRNGMGFQCDENKPETLSFHGKGTMTNDVTRRLSRQVDDVLCNGCNDLLLTPDGKMDERFDDSGDMKKAKLKPQLCMEDFIFTTPRRILHSLQLGGDIIESEAMQSDNRSGTASKGSETSAMEDKNQRSPSSSCCTSEEMNSSKRKEQNYLSRRTPKTRTRRNDTMSNKCSLEDSAILATDDDDVHKAKELLQRCLSGLDGDGERVARLSLDLKIGNLELLDKSTKYSSLGSSPIQTKMEKPKSNITLGSLSWIMFVSSIILIVLMLFQRVHQSQELHVLVPT